MAASAELVTLPDGRRLEVLTGGDEGGSPLVFHSGTPSAAVADPLIWDAAARAGLHLVTYSRPGYGASTPRPLPVADLRELAGICWPSSSGV